LTPPPAIELAKLAVVASDTAGHAHRSPGDSAGAIGMELGGLDSSLLPSSMIVIRRWEQAFPPTSRPGRAGRTRSRANVRASSSPSKITLPGGRACGRSGQPRAWLPRESCAVVQGRRATTSRERAFSSCARVVVLGPAASTGHHARARRARSRSLGTRRMAFTATRASWGARSRSLGTADGAYGHTGVVGRTFSVFGFAAG
jgi:hypothetical protein